MPPSSLPTMPASHIDNLLDFVPTLSKEGLTQAAGLAQRDEANGDLTEGGLGGRKSFTFIRIGLRRGTEAPTKTEAPLYPSAVTGEQEQAPG